MKENNEYFCQHPWVGLDITSQGEFKPCCKFGKVLGTSFEEYRNSAELIKVRDDFLNGRKSEHCKRCWNDEAAGIPSKRQLDWKYTFKEQQVPLDSFKVLGIAFGNSCNLACRICGSYGSSRWITEAEKLKEIFPNIKIFNHQRFYQDSEFIKELKQVCQGATLIEFGGGEVFMAGIPEHLELIDFLAENGPEDISLHYITNGTNFPDTKFWSRWAKFKKVDISFSIDGTGAQFEYNRWPGVWGEVESNIKKYIEYSKSLSNLQLSISHSVSIFTVYYLPEFVKWCLRQGLEKPYLGLVSVPEMYNIKCLPKSVKDKIAEKLGRFKFENVVSYMYSEDLNTADWSYIKVLDHQRGQNFNETFPEFSQILKEAGCQI